MGNYCACYESIYFSSLAKMFGQTDTQNSYSNEVKKFFIGMKLGNSR